MKHWFAKRWECWLFMIYLVLGLAIYRQYGVSWDEPLSRLNGLVNLRYVIEFFSGALRSELLQQVPTLADWPDRDYGVAFELPMAAIEHWLGLNEQQVFRLRHLSTFLVFSGAVAAIYRSVFSVTGSRAIGVMAAAMLVLSPRMFAESFYNSKDIVFMSACAISIWSMERFLRNRSLGAAVLHGLVCAFAIDIRVMGIILPALTMGAWGVLLVHREVRPMSWWRLMAAYGLVTVLMVYAMFPYLWVDPLHNFAQVFANMSRFRWNGEVLYMGESISAQQLPWHYIPVWIGVTTPLPFLALFLVGVGLTVAGVFSSRRRLWSSHEQMMDLLCLLLLAGPVLAVIALKSVLYDGWRQLYFVYPALVFLAARGLEWLGTMLGARDRRRLVLSGCLGTFIVYQGAWMVRAHPLQNVYFNELVRTPWKDQFDLDYWGLGNREALERILKADHDPFITVGVGSRTELETSLPLIPKVHRDRLFLVDPDAPPMYIVNNYRLVRDRSDARWLQDHALFWQKKIGDQVILSVYRLRDPSRATPMSRSDRPYTPEEILQLRLELGGRREVQGRSEVDVTLVNDSGIRFSALSATGNQLALTWRFLDAQGHPVTPWDGRMDLPVDVMPHSRQRLVIAFDPGAYLEGHPLQVDVFQTGRFWAHEAGAPLAILPPDRKTASP
ncbi:ArnT family glycosyltransferase [Hydrogenophaga sp. MI9]|uniref:ArnT family glycosyltransferase n=1 Tax=Hydrogenophaga sp. MI9 TaxID=3453719 RepID=UPI003EEB7CFE